MSDKITFGQKREEPEPKPNRKYAGHVDFDDEQKTVIKTKGMTRKPRKPKENYRPIKEGDLHQVIIDALKGDIKVAHETKRIMKSGFARKPFGGNRKGGGGWNSTAYAIFEAIERSGKVFVKKE